MKRDNRYWAIHEASHAIVGASKGLTVAKLSIGKTSTGMEGCTRFTKKKHAIERPINLLVLVAGRVGTRFMGFNNLKCSSQFHKQDPDWIKVCLQIGAYAPPYKEPGDCSDAWHLWNEGYSMEEIRQAESEALAILTRNKPALERLAACLGEQGTMNRKAIGQVL